SQRSLPHQIPTAADAAQNSPNSAQSRGPVGPYAHSMLWLERTEMSTNGAPVSVLHSGFRTSSAMGEEKNAPSVASTIRRSNSADRRAASQLKRPSKIPELNSRRIRMNPAKIAR